MDATKNEITKSRELETVFRRHVKVISWRGVSYTILPVYLLTRAAEVDEFRTRYDGSTKVGLLISLCMLGDWRRCWLLFVAVVGCHWLLCGTVVGGGSLSFGCRC